MTTRRQLFSRTAHLTPFLLAPGVWPACAGPADIDIQVAKDAQHTWRAFGSSVLLHNNAYETGDVSVEWERYNRSWNSEMGANLIRWWSSPLEDADPVEDFHQRYIAPGVTDLGREQGVGLYVFAPSVHTDSTWNQADWLVGHTLRHDKVADYADRCASIMEALWQRYGVRFEATGQVNEPGSGGVRMLVDPADYAYLAEEFRRKLDARGLNHVEVIGLEWQPPYQIARDYASAVAHLPAISALGAHCYSEGGPDYLLGQMGLEHGKTHFQTEAGGAIGGPAEIAGRMIHSINNGASVWVFFLGPGTDNLAGHFLVGTKGPDEPYYPEYYRPMKEISLSLPPGSEIHHCVSSLEGHMDWNKGNGRVYALAGLRPDQRWFVCLANVTGTPNNPYSNYRPAEDVIVSVELDVSPDRMFVLGGDLTGTWQTGQPLALKSRQYVTLTEVA